MSMSSGREYLAQFKVEESLAEAVAMVLRERNGDPIARIADFLKAKAARRAYTFMTIQPTFTVKDWALAKPIMDEFIEATKSETACVYYGWSTCGDKLFCREAYTDAAGALAHLDNVGSLVGKMLEAAASLDKIELHGPEAELEKCQEKMDGFGTLYYKTDGGISWMSDEAGGPVAPQTLMTIQPTFTVKDWALAEPIMKEFVEATNKETGAVYYGWTRQGDTLFCREAYTDAAGALAHLDNVGSLVGKMLEAAASLDKIELHGPEAELEKCKEKMDGFGTTYWPVYAGSFQKYTK